MLGRRNSHDSTGAAGESAADYGENVVDLEAMARRQQEQRQIAAISQQAKVLKTFLKTGFIEATDFTPKESNNLRNLVGGVSLGMNQGDGEELVLLHTEALSSPWESAHVVAAALGQLGLRPATARWHSVPAPAGTQTQETRLPLDRELTKATLAAWRSKLHTDPSHWQPLRLKDTRQGEEMVLTLLMPPAAPPSVS